MTGGLFLSVGQSIAAKYPEIEFEDRIVDATAMLMVTRPSHFDVIVTTNLFGDILSDLAAGLVGGLGVAPAANIGSDGAIFEAVHGTAPDIAGRGLANPTALMLSAALMLDHLAQRAAADRLRAGILAALANPDCRTGDLGGQATTVQFTDAVVANLPAE
jgi:isocitrate dehydrogenase (NAD+)